MGILSNPTPRQPPKEIPLRPLCGGVVLFDNNKEMMAGWACAHNGTPFRVSNPAQLPNDVIWVCNGDFDAFKLRSTRLHHLRRADYFRTPIGQIAADLGLRSEGEYAMETSSKLAEIVHRAFTLAVTLYGRNNLPLAPREETLAEDIRKVMPALKGLSESDYLRVPLGEAYQSYSSPNWSDRRDAQGDLVTVMLRANRTEYVKRLLSLPLPDEAWHYIQEPPADIGLDVWLDPAHPSLVEVQVMVFDEIGELLAFGAQLGKRSGIRRWVSQPELRMLVEHAEVNIRSGFLSLAARGLAPSYQLPALVTEDRMLELSYSAGLVAESHWHALTNPPWSRARREVETFPVNVWQRAYDRASCFAKALAAHEAGFIVKGYGNGVVNIRVHRTQLRELLMFAAREGFAYPSFPSVFREHDASLPELIEDIWQGNE